MEALAEEAMAFNNDGKELSIDEKVQRALECPCVANLRSGPCGTQFTDAFSCFLRSTDKEKGSDCVNPFIALQTCIKANPNAFSKDVLDEEEEEIIVSEKPIKAPTWARDTTAPKSKI